MSRNDEFELEVRNVEKKRVFEGMLSYDRDVFIHLDPRRAGVVVPSYLRSGPQVVLQVGFDMPVPIPDLRAEEDGIFGTLSFKGSPFTCFIPWHSVYALVDNTTYGRVWNDDVPNEILLDAAQEVSETAKTNPYIKPVNKAAAKAGWAVIDGGKQ